MAVWVGLAALVAVGVAAVGMNKPSKAAADSKVALHNTRFDGRTPMPLVMGQKNAPPAFRTEVSESQHCTQLFIMRVMFLSPTKYYPIVHHEAHKHVVIGDLLASSHLN